MQGTCNPSHHQDLPNQIEKLGDLYHPDTTAEDVISADENLMSTEPLLTDEEFIHEVMNGFSTHSLVVTKDKASHRHM